MADEMYSTNTHIGLFGYIILFVIIVWVFGGCFGGYGGFSRNGFGNGFGYDGWAINSFGPGGMGFKDYQAICDAEKGEITRTAATQYMIGQQANETRALVTAQTNALSTKIDFYEYQKLRDGITERDNTISRLKNEIFVKDQLAPVNAQLNYIQNNMLVRPNVTGVGVACPSTAILNGLGVNSSNNCGCNNLGGSVLV